MPKSSNTVQSISFVFFGRGKEEEEVEIEEERHQPNQRGEVYIGRSCPNEE